MIGQVFVIIFKDDKAYLTEDKTYSFSQLGFQEWVKSFNSPAFWEICILNHLPFENKIFVKILSYKIGTTHFFNNQIQLSEELNTIEKIVFQDIDTQSLIYTLGKQPKTMNGAQYVHIQGDESVFSSENKIKSESTRRTIKESFSVPLKNVRFKLGCVTFDKRFEDCDHKIEFLITNNDIREEFDAVKNYFANVLNKKKIDVTVNLEIVDNVVTSKSASSPDIEKINNQLIDNVRFEFVRSIIKKKISTEINKSLFTMDEYFDAFSKEKANSNIFYGDDKDFLEDIINITNTKHYKHLRFLSSKHAHKIMKLRFVHKPFSFIFLLEGKKNFHVIWETLDTKEATYIWHIEKDIQILKHTLKKIQDIINVLKVQGKLSYINFNDDPFRRINHNYSVLKDGFLLWKGELENYLT